MAETPVVEIVRLYVGRGLRTAPFGVDDEKLELAVDLYDLGVDYAASWVEWAGATSTGGSPADDTLLWMPLADADGVLVLDAGGALIPTLIPL